MQFLGANERRPKLTGLVPDRLKVRSARILLESLEVQADIGFHEFEIGAPQRLLVTVEIWLEDCGRPHDDDPAGAWNYDFLRSQVQEIAAARRYNLQETLAHEMFDRIAAFRGVRDCESHLQAGRLSGGRTAWGSKSLPFPERGRRAETAL